MEQASHVATRDTESQAIFYEAAVLSHTRGFPIILRAISERRENRRLAIKSLGPLRSTSAQRREYILRVVDDLRTLAERSLQGRYSLHADNRLKIRTMIREANDRFTEVMKTQGHSAIRGLGKWPRNTWAK